MPDLASESLFSGNGKANPNDLGCTEVINFNTSVDNKLRDNWKWKGKLTGAVGLSLSPDNQKVVYGVFITRGATGIKEQRINCDKIWPNSKDVFVAINFPSADIFRFESGGLFSNIVPSTRIMHTFHRIADNTVVLDDERAGTNITDFSARMICHLSGTSNGRRGIVMLYSIILFPVSATELTENPDSRFGSYPGIKFCEGAFPVLPRPTAHWGCPIVPFIMPGASFVDLPVCPPGQKLREAISSIMRKAAQPAALRNGELVIARWAHLRTHPTELGNIPADTTWPDAGNTPEPEGKTLNLIITYIIRMSHILLREINPKFTIESKAMATPPPPPNFL
jgi:hypothetical protein